MKKVKVSIKGTSPLLQHRYEFRLDCDERSKKKTGRKDYTEEWKAALYTDPKLGVVQPAVHIESAMIKAAGDFQIPGKGKKTYRDLFKSAVFVSPELVPHGLKGAPDELLKKGKLRVDRRLVRIKGAGVERLRPRLDEWSLSFTVEIHDDQLHPDVVRDVLIHAGRFVGIGDFRPRHGRFDVIEFK